MAPLVLEGDTLGEKHQFYNKLLNEASATNQPLLEPSQDDDIRTLLNIDIASKRRNVEFILEVLKSEDQLYVSKAIQRSTWLFTDPQYAHIINPEHLYTELSPLMTSRAFNKLLLNIRLHLKEEKRVEAFYNYIKEKDVKAAFKWLQHCSVPFVETEVAKHNRDIPDHLVLRLFEKSFSIFEVYTKQWEWIMKQSEFLLKKHADKFLDLLENSNRSLYFDFSAKGTKTLMKKCPQRILDKIEFYRRHLSIATFAKHLNKTINVKDFLLKHAKNEKMKGLYKYSKLKHFIWQIPRETRFEFVKKLIIDKEMGEGEDDDNRSMEEDRTFYCAMACRGDIYTSQNTDTYQWYKFAPFDTAFIDLKKFIRAESVPEQRNLILQVMLSCAGRNMEHIRTVLQFYRDKHINEPFKFKIQFVNAFISKVDTHYLDDKTWDILRQLFHSMEVYIESDNNVQFCVRAIIVRNVIRNEQVSDIIKNKFEFDTLKTIQKKLKNQEDKDSVFHFLRDIIAVKSNSLNVTIESEFNEAVTLCEKLFNLINDWDKVLQDHSYALDKVKALIKVKKEKGWSRDLSSLYNTNKSWRKTMFEESIAILATEEVCVNVLKHNPGLLSRNKERVEAIRFNDAVSLRHLLSKIRIYWPSTLANDWKTAYLERLDQPGGHKALAVGLCTLLPTNEVSNLLQKYAPSETKIDWNETNQLELSLRKQIAKNVYKARPLAPVEGILLFAKGDYLQYAVPSLNAILSQLSSNKSRHYISTLLDAPVSLQKFGVRWAFHKLPSEELKPILTNIWNSTKSSSIRTVLFTHTFQLLCKEKKASHIKEIWDLLCMFIDKLTPDDNKLLFRKLGEVSDVPDTIKPQFYMKSYIFLSSLPAKCNCESILNQMQSKATEFIELLDNDFVVNVMLKKFIEVFDKERYNIYDNSRVVSSFILACKDEKTQTQRYEMSLGIILQKHLPQWNNIRGEQYPVKENIKEILESLADISEYTFEKKMQMPLKTFETILHKLEVTLSYQKDYVVLTQWKLMVNYVKILDETKLVTMNYKKEADDKAMSDEEKDKMFSETHKKIAPLFAKTCVQHLKEDLDKFGSSLFLLFSKSFAKFFRNYLSRSMCKLEDQIEYAISLLRYENEREIWLMVYNLLESHAQNVYSDSEKKKFEEVREIVLSQPCDELRMHYYELFSDVIPYVPKTTN